VSLTQGGQWIKPHILPAEIPLAATSNSCGFFRPHIWASPGQAELVVTSSVLAILTDFHSDNLSSKVTCYPSVWAEWLPRSPRRLTSVRHPCANTMRTQSKPIMWLLSKLV